MCTKYKSSWFKKLIPFICLIITERHTKIFENQCMPNGLLGWGSFFATMAFKRGSLLEKFLLKNPTFNASNELIFRNIFIKCTKI